MIKKEVVFFPKPILDSPEITVDLVGLTKLVNDVRYYFIFANSQGTRADCYMHKFGHFTRTTCYGCSENTNHNILCITEIDGNLSANWSLNRLNNFVIILYEPSDLCDYGTILKNENDINSFVCFIMLSKWLSYVKNTKQTKNWSDFKLTKYIASYVLILLNALVMIFDLKILKATLLRLTLFQYMLDVAKNYVWVIENLMQKNNVSSKIKVINYLISCIWDAIIGIFCIYFFNTIFESSNNFFSYTSSISYVIMALQSTLQWLMGSPAGLKLNDPLNSLLGTCFLFLVNLWWSFLVICRPFLEFTFQVYMFIGKFGLSFQIAILEDVLAIVSLHVYWIYVYAAWLYKLQWKSLMILAKLFVGRSCTPQPGRSIPYTTQQLYVGTISFAILLFLLPTTLIYYIVFVVLRILLVMTKGVLIRLRYALQVLPIYTSLIWFFKPNSAAGIIKLNIASKSDLSNTVVLDATLVADSWWATVNHYIPESIKRPLTVSWMTLLERVCTGKLLYPI
ncbi:phosphatidylinositol N-acetylglucosaminyltransferase subunit Q isoform X2 [Adelges cooleyi]|uniref:phosphatidylinositol N-acetylglucosaminyltransferase subunit Q isoform X2 n=1 Tax=Adelges cooleyi TaxID=133065 RepID=UPI00217FC642|nr:phosphatidylinositol N-acetylglucosaminyltransferase subunit Q isoform X2 [Adelges cooleyi]